MASLQGNDSAASKARHVRAVDTAEREQTLVTHQPEPYPRSVADALESFAHDRLLAELARAHEQIAHLEAAVDSNRDIGTAIGILMAEGSLTQEQAFERLRVTGQNSHRKLRDIAAEVVGDGLPGSPARAPSAPSARPPSPRPPGAS